MRDPLSRSFSSPESPQDSWLHRVCDNFHQLLTPANIFPSSANGAPLHLLTLRRNPIAHRARTVSFLTHSALLVAILLLKVPSPSPGTQQLAPETTHGGSSLFFPIPDAARFGHPSLGKSSGGGEEDSRPTRHGLLAPGSSVPLAPPRRLANMRSELSVPVSVFDANAPQFPAPVTNLGLPWMKADSDSPGSGRQHGFGSGTDGGMGDKNGPGAGQGEAYDGTYANIVSPPRCAYCPDPQYTDEAREAKLQGTVTLEVFVGADGRALQIRLAKGIGLGLDDRAVQSVRGWKFIPAHDASRRPVASWVTVEVVFRLF